MTSWMHFSWFSVPCERTSAATRGRLHPPAFHEEFPWGVMRPALHKFLLNLPSHAELLILTVPRAAGMAISGQLYRWEH